MKRKRSGWQKQHAVNWATGPDAVGIVMNIRAAEFSPSGWEVFLRKLQVSEASVIVEVRQRTSAGQAIREWIDRNNRHRFVPEAVLRSLGIPTWD